MADSSERNNPPHFEEEEQQQREITNNQPQAEPDDDDDEDYVDDDSDEEDEEEVEEEEEEDSYSEEEEEVEEEEEEDSYSEEEEAEDEEEYMNPSVRSPRVSVNSVEVVGEPNGCGQGGKVAAVAGEGGEVDGLICPICMEPWTSAGDHQVCCLSCGHLYGLSCIRRWLERRKGSAKCPQCNQKCKPKDVRVLYASRVVVADEESKEKIQFLEAKCALLEETSAYQAAVLPEGTPPDQPIPFVPDVWHSITSDGHPKRGDRVLGMGDYGRQCPSTSTGRRRNVALPTFHDPRVDTLEAALEEERRERAKLTEALAIQTQMQEENDRRHAETQRQLALLMARFDQDQGNFLPPPS